MKDVEFKLEERSMEEFLQAVHEEHDVNFWIDSVELSNEAISLDTQVKPTVAKQSLADHLKSVFEPLNLVFYVDGEVVKVTTNIAAEEEMVTRVYDARKQVRQTGSAERVKELVQNTDGTGVWMSIDHDGGDIGIIGPLLVIKQTRNGHQKIAGMLK